MLYCTCIIHILYMYCPYTVHVLCTYCACMLLLNKTLTDAGTRCWQAREVLLCPSGSYLPQQQCYSAPSDIQVGNMSTGTRWSEYSSAFAPFYCQKTAIFTSRLDYCSSLSHNIAIMDITVTTCSELRSKGCDYPDPLTV